MIPFSHSLSAEVQSLLDTGIDVYVETVLTDNDNLSGPQFVQFRLDRAFVDWANERISTCTACGFSEAKVLRAPADHDKTSDVGCISNWEFVISGPTSFWFTGGSRGGNTCESRSLTLQYLTDTLVAIASKGDVDDDDNAMTWHGNCLFHSEDDIEGLMEYVLELHPEIEAAETAKQMTSAISAAYEPKTAPEPQEKPKSRRASI